MLIRQAASARARLHEFSGGGVSVWSSTAHMTSGQGDERASILEASPQVGACAHPLAGTPSPPPQC